jgi:hypothetical protein
MQTAVVDRIGPRATVFEMLTASEAASRDGRVAGRCGSAGNGLGLGGVRVARFRDVRAALRPCRARRDLWRRGAPGCRAAAFATGAAAVFRGRCGAVRPDRVRWIPMSRRRGRPSSRRPIATRCPRRSCRVSWRRSVCAMRRWPRPRWPRWRHTDGRWWSSRATATRATDWGVPALLALAAPEVAVFSLGQFEAEPDGRGAVRRLDRRRPRGPAGPLRGIPLNGRRIAAASLGSCSPTGGCASLFRIAVVGLRGLCCCAYACSSRCWPWPDPLFRHERGGGLVTFHATRPCRPKPSSLARGGDGGLRRLSAGSSRA